MEKTSSTRTGRKLRAFGCRVFEVNDKPYRIAQDNVRENLELKLYPLANFRAAVATMRNRRFTTRDIGNVAWRGVIHPPTSYSKKHHLETPPNDDRTTCNKEENPPWHCRWGPRCIAGQKPRSIHVRRLVWKQTDYLIAYSWISLPEAEMF